MTWARQRSPRSGKTTTTGSSSARANSACHTRSRDRSQRPRQSHSDRAPRGGRRYGLSPARLPPAPSTQQQGGQRHRPRTTRIHSRPSQSRLPPLAQYSVGSRGADLNRRRHPPVSFAELERPDLAGTDSSRRALQAVTGSSHSFGGRRLTGLAGDSRSRPTGDIRIDTRLLTISGFIRTRRPDLRRDSRAPA